MTESSTPNSPFKDRREGEWHLDKRIPLTLIFSVVLLVGGQLVVYGQTTEKFKALHNQMNEATEDRIRKETVLRMFENRDLQLEVLREDIKEIKQTVKEGNIMILQLLREFPGKTTNTTQTVKSIV